MKKILIISATSNTNLKLARTLNSFIKDVINTKIINLESYNLPLFNPSKFDQDKEKFKKDIEKLTNILIEFEGFIICAPEYNGSIPPVVTNAIAWISTTTSYWKDAFKDKNVLVTSSSGGMAENFQISMENQMIHLGANVFSKKIIINESNNIKPQKAKKILIQFINL